MLVGLVRLPLAPAMLAANNGAHRDATGVDAPSRDAMRRTRRNARKKGISNGAAHEQWLENKQRRRRL